MLIDGLGDVSVEELGGLTPLQAARTPYMDAVAGTLTYSRPHAVVHGPIPHPTAGGLNGLMDPVAPGLACGSDTAHLSLLGYNPITYAMGHLIFLQHTCTVQPLSRPWRV